jgi:hypothetical protein
MSGVEMPYAFPKADVHEASDHTFDEFSNRTNMSDAARDRLEGLQNQDPLIYSGPIHWKTIDMQRRKITQQIHRLIIFAAQRIEHLPLRYSLPNSHAVSFAGMDANLSQGMLFHQIE